MLSEDMAAPPVVRPDPKAAPPGRKHAGALPYDFARPDRLAADKLRALQPIHTHFAQGFGLNISAYLRTMVSVSVSHVEQLSFGEFSRKMAPPLTLVPLRLHPHDGHAILQLSHQAVFPILEMLLGGTAGSAENIDRDMTVIEKCVFEPVLRILVQELRAAWNILGSIEFGIQDQAAAPQIIAGIPASEPFLSVMFELRIGQVGGALQLGLPSRIVQPLLAVLQPRAQEPEDCSKMLRLLERAAVTADARLSGLKVLFNDLMNLQAGDVLVFDHPLTKEVQLELNGTPKFKGHVIAAAGRRAFQINRLIQPDANPQD